jgi:hypothetical protein
MGIGGVQVNVYQFIMAAAGVMLLAACETTGGSSSLSTGPALSTSESVREVRQIDDTVAPKLRRLDVYIAVLDPGVPDDPSKLKDDDWPELRRAEARYMAVRVRDTLSNTAKFGAIRVTPNTEFASDLYVEGEILESDGEQLKLKFTVTDSTGKKWFSKRYSHRVKSSWYKTIRNADAYPFQPLYDDFAAELIKRLAKQKDSNLEKIQVVTDMRFAQNLSPDAFADVLQIKRGRVKLERIPAENDPMFERVAAIRYRDQMFVDNMQDRYDSFSSDISDSYRYWQSQSCAQVERKREARNKAIMKGLAGALLIVGAVAAGSDNNYGNDYAAVAAGAAGGALLVSSWKDSKEANIHSDVINELANSLEGELAPKVIEMEDQTITLTGNMAEQTQQWRSVLAEIWEAEELPESTEFAM